LDVTDGGCSCSIYRGPLDRSTQNEHAHWRRRYQRKGWSAAKIERALESKREDRQRRRDAAAEFCGAVEHIIKSGGVVAVLAHGFQGRFAEEQVRILSHTAITLIEYLAGEGRLPEDTVVTVT